MSLVAEFDLAGSVLPLTDVAGATAAELTVEELRPNEVAPVMIVHVDGDWDSFEAAVKRPPDNADPAVVTDADDGRLYRVVLAEAPGVDLEALALSKAVVERVSVTDGGWHVRATFSDREELIAIRELCRANGLAFSLRRLARDDDPPGRDLTDRQREALATAHEMGYFEVPRRASMADVADALDIAPASLSERFRRGQARLVERHVDPDLKPRTD